MLLCSVVVGCGSSDETPRQGDNPAAVNSKSSTEMADRAAAREQEMHPSGLSGDLRRQ